MSDTHTPEGSEGRAPLGRTGVDDAYGLDADTVAALFHLRDKWQAEIRGRLREVETERDALAAHVERLKTQLSEHQRLLASGVLYTYKDLARRDLIKQAEALEGLLAQYKTRFSYLNIDAAEVKCKAAELRRQAGLDLCVDGGCPHHGTPHVCISRQVEEDS